MRIPTGFAVLALAVGLFHSASRSQALVVISEIEFKDQWIEIANLGTTEADLSNWSVYQATNTPDKAGNYWFGFPLIEDPKTMKLVPIKLPSGGFLRVHWRADNKNKKDTVTDIYTGNTVHHFLFGLFAEQLDSEKGALALMSTQSNAQVNNPSVIQDWVSWGKSGTIGFKREGNAVTAKRWVRGSLASPPGTATPLPSLASFYTNVGGAKSNLDWFLDASPTPGKDNIGGAKTQTYGTSCKANLSQIAALIAVGLPVLGYSEFEFGIQRSLAASEPAAIMQLSAVPDRAGTLLPSPINCTLYLSPTGFLGAFPVLPDPANRRARFKLPPGIGSGIAGKSVFSQWLVIDVGQSGVSLGFTNGLEILFGN